MASEKFRVSRDTPAPYITNVAKDRLPVFQSDAIKTIINYIDRQTLSVLAPYIKIEYQWSNTDFAMLIIAFRVAYALGQTASGRMQEKIYSIYTKTPINYRGRDRLHFDFTLTPSGNCDEIGRWLRQGINASGNARLPGTRPKAGSRPQIRKYPVVHTRDLARDFSGTLIVSEKTIEFECPQDSGRSRRWALKDIRKVEQRTPYLLMVFPCTTDKYTFEFPAKGMEPTVFRALRNRISQASDCK